MKRRFAFLVLALAALLLIIFVVMLYRSMEPHADVDRAVSEAINEPGGGDYAKAVDVVRGSNESDIEKQFEIGRLVIGSYDRQVARRPSESLRQGLHMLEQAAVKEWMSRNVAQDQLRLAFERGVGSPPDQIPSDPEIAACWRGVLNGGANDPVRCVHLRQERLPQLG